jgi:hypothetical protein
MDDRFDRTEREADAAIARARARQSIARGRRRELEERIAELELPHPPHRVQAERTSLTQARDRAARAHESSERARQRAAEAQARRPAR